VYCYVNQHNWVLTWSTAIEVVLNIVLSILFIRWFGLPGIPLATVLAYVLQKIFLIRYVKVRFGARLQDYLPVPQSIWYFSVLIGSVVIAELIYF
jgi:Na+-driven multidrug efflux pump